MRTSHHQFLPCCSEQQFPLGMSAALVSPWMNSQVQMFTKQKHILNVKAREGNVK
jgi:hypothetical protein